MGGILNSQRKDSPGVTCGAKALYVRSCRFDNTAAKFWTCLWDEIAADCPPGTILQMSAPSGGLLTPDLLVPVRSLQRDMEQLDAETVQDAFTDALAALAVIGPPAGVLLRLMPPPEAGEAHEMTLDYLDAEIMPFLLAWLLEWAGVSDAQWNEPVARGTFAGDDYERRLRYLVAFELRSRHLSEGLFLREVSLRFQREGAP